MKLVSLAGVASAALAFAVNVPAPASAADLGGMRGSMKDGYQPMPVIQQSSAGPCYFRGDVGYSWSQAPKITWPVNSIDNTTTPATTTFVTDQVTNTGIENSWFAEGGMGCGWGGSRGVRLEAMLGMHGSRAISGEPGNFTVTDPLGVPTTNGGSVDPLHTSLKSYTLMVNGYKDLGNFGGFVPYVGAGIGAAYHKLDDVYFTGNPALTNAIHGNNDLTFAWSLMAGVGYQISDRAIIDVGYRYIDMGKIESQRSDSGGFVNPAVHFDDLTAHEIKVGLRYSFGGGNDCCAVEHAPLK
jgi:opacity protein-like surface antigen